MRALLPPVLALAVAFLVLVVVVWAFQRRLMYLPTQELLTPPPHTTEVVLETDDGLRLEAWWTDPVGEKAGTVLFFHGNAGNRSHRGTLTEVFAAAGFSVLSVDYRGYGGNPGQLTERGLEADARAALAYVLARSDVDPEKLVYYGGSLGSAAAVYLATVREPAALVLRSPFTSMAEVARHHYFFLPVRTLLRDRYPSDERITSLRAPLLVLAGEEDRVVPAKLSRKLFDAASAPKRWFLLPKVDHNDRELFDGPRATEAILDFARECLEG